MRGRGHRNGQPYTWVGSREGISIGAKSVRVGALLSLRPAPSRSSQQFAQDRNDDVETLATEGRSESNLTATAADRFADGHRFDHARGQLLRGSAPFDPPERQRPRRSDRRRLFRLAMAGRQQHRCNERQAYSLYHPHISLKRRGNHNSSRGPVRQPADPRALDSAPPNSAARRPGECFGTARTRRGTACAQCHVERAGIIRYRPRGRPFRSDACSPHGRFPSKAFPGSPSRAIGRSTIGALEDQLAAVRGALEL